MCDNTHPQQDKEKLDLLMAKVLTDEEETDKMAKKLAELFHDRQMAKMTPEEIGAMVKAIAKLFDKRMSQ